VLGIYKCPIIIIIIIIVIVIFFPWIRQDYKIHMVMEIVIFSEIKK